MSAEYGEKDNTNMRAEYDHENIQTDPIRIRQRFVVNSIRTTITNAEVELLAEGVPGGFISLSVPIKVAAAFHLGQGLNVMLTETTELKPDEG